MPTAKHASRLPTPTHPTALLWARACCVAARQGLTVLGGRYIVGGGNLKGRSHMSPEPQKNMHAAMLGSLGGLKRRERLNATERSAIARHAARSRWHPREAQAAREKAQEISYLIQQALKDGKQLPLI